MSAMLVALALVAALAPAEPWRDRRHWDWGQHDMGAGMARVPQGAPGLPDGEAPDAPLLLAEPPR